MTVLTGVTEPEAAIAPPHDAAEKTLILAVQKLLALSGAAFSQGAMRDLPDLVGERFDPRAAVSALRHLGHDASFGELPAAALQPGHCPAIGFDAAQGAVLIVGIAADGSARVVRFDTASGTEEQMPAPQWRALLGPFFILSRKGAETPRQAGDWFWGALRQNRWLFAQVIVAAMVTNFLGLSTSLFTMVVYDRVVPNAATESLIALTIGVLIALSFDFIIKTLRGQFVDRASKRADLNVLRQIFERILAMRLDTRVRNSGAMAGIVREFDTLRDFFTSATLLAVVDLPFIFFFIWVIYLIAGPLALIHLVAVPIVVIVGVVLQPFLARLSEGAMTSAMSKQAVLVETLNGLETVQATGSGRLMRRRFEEAVDAQSDLGLRNRMLSQLAINAAASTQQLAQVATIFFGVFLIQEGQITMGAMIAAMILGGRALAPLSQLAAALSRANAARQAYRSLSAFMAESTAPEARGTSRLSRPELRGEIELRGVSYTFPGARAPVLRDLTLKIPAGQKVALVGRMGSGKSTLLRILAGLVEPSAGAVLIDGIDLRQIDRSDVRRNIGVMLQDSWLFSGTLKENLQMGFYEYDDAHLLRVARVAGVDDFVGRHPQGYDMAVKERGEGLSGGQRQSINLARALLHDPNLLLLDEPTSAMDRATETTVLERLSDWAKGRTVVAVTHRNSLFAMVDRVLVIDQGAVIADTTPEKLRAAQR